MHSYFMLAYIYEGQMCIQPCHMCAYKFHMLFIGRIQLAGYHHTTINNRSFLLMTTFRQSNFSKTIHRINCFTHLRSSSLYRWISKMNRGIPICSTWRIFKIKLMLLPVHVSTAINCNSSSKRTSWGWFNTWLKSGHDSITV